MRQLIENIVNDYAGDTGEVLTAPEALIEALNSWLAVVTDEVAELKKWTIDSAEPNE